MATTSSNSIAIVTGASRGIGKAITLHLLSKNVSVVGLARSASALEIVSEEAGKLQTSAKLIPVAGDVTDESVQQQAVDLATQNGTLIALVNNAAITEPFALIADAAVDDWKKQFDVNLFAPLSLIKKSLPQLRQSRGKVINLTSAIFKTPTKNQAGYSGSKAAISYMTQTLALEEPDITAIAVHPGIVDTDMVATFYTNARDAEPEREISGRIIGNLALFAEHELTGAYVEYDEPKLSKYAE
ncbi:NAD(P)-binding protein [Linderina pennispora]|uniref:3-oxoacyl-[acyl-carrier-protein] reductase n=1 Tax=Linderina pennispora TaxID=61395 RepID=A0A1Y1WGP9_9FUNG|nr:NAD(P)-binding protein [Linderina pennispora]ORX72689.1 NAD(P)-binding protein [Linderina pennispora]